MKRIYITICSRVGDAPDEGPSEMGHIVAVDWDSKCIIERIFLTDDKGLYEGRTRGVLGIAWHEDFIYVCISSKLFALDPNTYEVAHELSLGEPGGFHQLAVYEDKLWITATSADVKISIVDRQVVDRIHVDGDPSGPEFQDLKHFNSMAWDNDGDCYHVNMTPRLIVNHTRQIEVLKLEEHDMLHDICFINDDEFLVSSSNTGSVLKCNKITGEYRTVFSKEVTRMGTGYRMLGLVRGLAFDKGTNSVFVGMAPGIIYELDAETFEEKNSFELCVSSPSTTYDILLDPRDWG